MNVLHLCSWMFKLQITNTAAYTSNTNMSVASKSTLMKVFSKAKYTICMALYTHVLSKVNGSQKSEYL